MLNSRNITDLDPDVQPVCNKHVYLCRAAGIELLITSTYRDNDAQDALYAIGRTVHPERLVVTHATGGHSWHNYRAAWDVVPLVHGKAVWNDKDPLWKEVIILGKQAGAQAGADWPFPKTDMPHFQFIPDISLDEAMVRWKDRGTIFEA